MPEVLEAVFEDGVFKPITSPQISEGQKVKIIINTIPKSKVDDLLDLARQVYEGLSDQEIEEIEQISLNRKNFFGSDDL